MALREQHVSIKQAGIPSGSYNNRVRERSSRSGKALVDNSSIGPLFYENGKWQPWYEELISLVDATCIYRGICSHGLDHSLAVAANGTVLAAAVGDRLNTGTEGEEILAPADLERISSPTLYYAYSFLHDLGYLFGRWQGLHAVDHPVQSGKITEELMDNFLPSWVQEQSHQVRRSWEDLQQLRPFILPMVASNTSEALARISRQPHGLSPLDIAIAAGKVADNMDFFSRHRIGEGDGIKPPTSFTENPYYYLAQAVAAYEFGYNGETLQHRLQIVQLMDFERWLAEAVNYYPQIWLLVDKFTHLLGLSFQVVDLGSNRVYSVRREKFK